MNSLAGGIIGIYVIMVAYNNKADLLLSEIKKEKGFLIWLISIAIILQIDKIPFFKGYRNIIIALIITAFLLNVSKNFFNNITKVITP